MLLADRGSGAVMLCPRLHHALFTLHADFFMSWTSSTSSFQESPHVLISVLCYSRQLGYCIVLFVCGRLEERNDNHCASGTPNTIVNNCKVLSRICLLVGAVTIPLLETV